MMMLLLIGFDDFPAETARTYIRNHESFEVGEKIEEIKNDFAGTCW